MKFLIVEDNDDIRTALEIALTEEGYDVSAVENSQQAFTELERATPDLILLDMHLPGMSGVEILKKIRLTLNMPVVMFTSSGETAVVEDAIAAGATDYVLKGTGMEELVGRVRKHLPSKDGTAELPAPRPTAANPPLIVYVGQDATVNRLLADVARRHDIGMAKITSGKDALTRLSMTQPSVIVIDLKLQETDGLSLLKAIKSNKAAPDFPIVMIADGEPPEVRRSALRRGASAIFSIPLSEVEFEQMVRELALSGKGTGAA